LTGFVDFLWTGIGNLFQFLFSHLGLGNIRNDFLQTIGLEHCIGNLFLHLPRIIKTRLYPAPYFLDAWIEFIRSGFGCSAEIRYFLCILRDFNYITSAPAIFFATSSIVSLTGLGRSGRL